MSSQSFTDESANLAASMRAFADFVGNSASGLREKVACFEVIMHQVRRVEGDLKSEHTRFQEAQRRLDDKAADLARHEKDLSVEKGKVQALLVENNKSSKALQRDRAALDMREHSGLTQQLAELASAVKEQKDQQVTELQGALESARLATETSAAVKREMAWFSNQVDQLTNEKSQLSTRTEQLERDNNLLSAETERLRNDNSRLEADVGRLDTDMSLLFAENEMYRKDKSNLLERVKKLGKERFDLSTDKSGLSTILQEKNVSLSAQVRELSDQKDEAQRSVDEYKTKCVDFERQLLEANKRADDRDALLQQLASARRYVSNMQEELASRERELANRKREVQLSIELEVAEQTKLIDERDKTIADLNRQMAELSSTQVTSASEMQAQIESLEEVLRQRDQEIAILNDRVDKLRPGARKRRRSGPEAPVEDEE
ncbi:hypothetical protein F5X99DRAFT_404874 [Biscogniauxia marginata]|nr:hypothetical protein F5X99DRAFT_404874 [Biscogniauxia marginata]